MRRPRRAVAPPHRPRAGADAYDFSHDRIREVAYAALSPARRRRHHLRVARALERAAAPAGRGERRIAAHYERGRGAPRGGRLVRARRRRGAAPARRTPTRSRSLERALALAAPAREPDRDTRSSRSSPRCPAPLVGGRGYASARLTRPTSARSRSPAPRRRAGPAAAALAGARAASPAATSTPRDGFGERLRARGERDGDDVRGRGRLRARRRGLLAGRSSRPRAAPRGGGRALPAGARDRPTSLRYGQDPRWSA